MMMQLYLGSTRNQVTLPALIMLISVGKCMVHIRVEDSVFAYRTSVKLIEPYSLP